MKNDIRCNGIGCIALNGVGHSAECETVHDIEVYKGAGNRNREARYAGYKKQIMPKPITEDVKAAWIEGYKARLVTTNEL